jgi:hypothetical protein
MSGMTLCNCHGVLYLDCPNRNSPPAPSTSAREGDRSRLLDAQQLWDFLTSDSSCWSEDGEELLGHVVVPKIAGWLNVHSRERDAALREFVMRCVAEGSPPDDEYVSRFEWGHEFIVALTRRLAESANTGWQLAHDPASCGHPRACWQDPDWPESDKVAKCIMCAALVAQKVNLGERDAALRELVAKWRTYKPQRRSEVNADYWDGTAEGRSLCAHELAAALAAQEGSK